MIEVGSLKVDGKAVLSVKVNLPDSPPILALIGDRGFVMCGFLNIKAAEKLGVIAAMVSGVRTIEDVLNADVKAATTKAEKMGIKPGLKGYDAIKLLI
jgi:uncharacterized protein YunC (DUF1805 family)